MTTNILVTASLIMALYLKTPQYISTKTFVPDQTDTLKDFKVSLTRVTECSKPTCMESTLMKAQNLKSFLLVYKIGAVWIVERSSIASKKIMKQYPVKKISIGTGNIIINGKAISEKHLVILEGNE